MEAQTLKCVMIIDETIPLGLIANTAAVMGMTLGKLFPQTVGPDVHDQSGGRHVGIVAIPIPILKASQAVIQEMRARLRQPEFADVTAVDFSDVAQSCKNYDEFTEKIAATPENNLTYFGLALCGHKKQVNKLTGSLPLLR
jgi:hypothetical protein